MKHRVTPSLVIAVIAVFLACAGGATAASKLITGKSIKDGSITGADIKRASIGPSKLSDGIVNDIQSAKERPMTAGPAGAAGPAGLQGPAGPAGPAGPSGVTGVKVVTSSAKPFAGGGVVLQTIDCPAGAAVVGGGYRFAAGGQTSIAHSIGWDAPVGNGWGVIIISNDTTGDELIVEATCATGPSATTRGATLRSASPGEFATAFNALGAAKH